MPSSESALPDNTTLMVVAVEPRLLLDPSVRASLAGTEVGTFIDTYVADQNALYKRVGIRLVDLIAVSSGEMSLGYVRPRLPPIPGHAPAAPAPPAFFVTVEINGNEEEANAILDGAIKQLISNQFRKCAVRAAYRSVRHLQISTDDAKAMPAIMSRERALSIHTGVLFAVDRMSVAKALIDNLSGTSAKSLAHSQAFIAVMTACSDSIGGRTASLRWFTCGSDSSSNANGGCLTRQDDQWKVVERSIR